MQKMTNCIIDPGEGIMGHHAKWMVSEEEKEKVRGKAKALTLFSGTVSPEGKDGKAGYSQYKGVFDFIATVPGVKTDGEGIRMLEK